MAGRRNARTTPDVILTKIVEQLIALVEGANPDTCYISMNAGYRPGNAGAIWFTVTLGGGKFDEGMWAGGGRGQCETDTNVTVTIHSPVVLDESGHDVEFLNDASVGILLAVTDVMNALAGFDPVNDDLDILLREPMAPNGWEEPERRSEWCGSIGIVFSIKFDWDLLETFN